MYEAVKMPVKPPKHMSYVQEAQKCPICGDISATPKMRQANTKDSNNAYNKYKRETTGMWG